MACVYNNRYRFHRFFCPIHIFPFRGVPASKRGGGGVVSVPAAQKKGVAASALGAEDVLAFEEMWMRPRITMLLLLPAIVLAQRGGPDLSAFPIDGNAPYRVPLGMIDISTRSPGTQWVGCAARVHPRPLGTSFRATCITPHHRGCVHRRSSAQHPAPRQSVSRVRVSSPSQPQPRRTPPPRVPRNTCAERDAGLLRYPLERDAHCARVSPEHPRQRVCAATRVSLIIRTPAISARVPVAPCRQASLARHGAHARPT